MLGPFDAGPVPCASAPSASGLQLLAVDLGAQPKPKLIVQVGLADTVEVLVYDSTGGRLLAWIAEDSVAGSCLVELNLHTGVSSKPFVCTEAYYANGGVAVMGEKGSNSAQMVYSSLLSTTNPPYPVWATVDVSTGSLEATCQDDFVINLARVDI